MNTSLSLARNMGAAFLILAILAFLFDAYAGFRTAEPFLAIFFLTLSVVLLAGSSLEKNHLPRLFHHPVIGLLFVLLALGILTITIRGNFITWWIILGVFAAALLLVFGRPPKEKSANR